MIRHDEKISTIGLLTVANSDPILIPILILVSRELD